MLVSPGWTTYAPQVNLTGRKPLRIIQTTAATDWKLTPSLLQASMLNTPSSRNKLLIFNNPGNPCKYLNRNNFFTKWQYTIFICRTRIKRISLLSSIAGTSYTGEELRALR